MDLERARYLLSAAGQEALAAAAPQLAGLDPLAMQTRLRTYLPPFEAGAVGEQVVLRAEAAARWREPAPFLLSREGMEMMTHPAVARRRARRLAAADLPVADLTCGLGGDLAAIAATGARTVGIEADTVTAMLAAANAPRAAVARGDATMPPLDLSRFAVMTDPGRRSKGRREFDPAAFSPPLDRCLDLAAAAALGVVKTAPGIDHALLPLDAEAEWVQVGRVLRECAIWRGAGVVPGLRRAVYLPAAESLDSSWPARVEVATSPGPFLIDPESCVTRAGLVAQLAARHGASFLDRQVAYLTAASPATTALGATFAVLDVLPFSLEALRTRLRTQGWHPDEVRRRAFPIEPDELRRLLGRIEGEPVTLLCTTVGARRLVIVGRRVRENCTRV